MVSTNANGSSGRLSNVASAHASRNGTGTPDSENPQSQYSSMRGSLAATSELSFNSVPSPGAAELLRPHPYVDNLCRKFELSPNQSAELNEMVGVCFLPLYRGNE